MSKLSMVKAQAVAELAKLLMTSCPAPTPASLGRMLLHVSVWRTIGPVVANFPPSPICKKTRPLDRDKFCDLIVESVQEGIAYRIKKNNPVKRREIDDINRVLLKSVSRFPSYTSMTSLVASPPTRTTKARRRGNALVSPIK